VIPSTREEYRRLVEAQDLNTDSGRAMYASLIAVSGAFANITQASNSASTSLSNTAASIADAAQASFDNAQSIANSSLSDLANSIDAQKTSLQNEYDTALKNYNNRLDSVNNSISKLQVLATSLKSTLDGMRISGSDTLYRINAQAQIREVIASVKSGGSLPLNGQLDSALATLSKPSEQLFATFEDYAKDFYATANDISMLGDLTGQQLTADEQMQKLLRSQIYTLDSGFNAQINALNDIYNSAKLQLDALNGINTNILSVNAALGNFNSSISSLSTAKSSLSTAKSAVEAIKSDPVKNAVQAAYAAIGRSGNIDQGGYDFWTQNLSNGNISMDQFQNTFLNSAANSTNSNYQSAIDQAKLLLARGDDLPGFAIGTNYVPNDMTARIHQGERIIPAADNQQLINLLQSSPSSNSLIAEIQALRAEVRALKSSNESIAKSTAKFANQFETASEGGRAMLTEAYV
jgi:prefoldin subunit 5